MKTHFIRIVVLYPLLFFSSVLNAQEKKLLGFIKDNDIFGTRNFIENKGQFQNPVGKEKVLFLYDHEGEKIYFTSSGLIHEQVKKKALDEHDMEEEEEQRKGGKKETEPERHYVTMNWVGSNSGVEIISSEKQGHYFTYGGPEYDSYAFKKIIYKNVFDKIDIEYVIPEDKTHGIKYSVILHPGADVNDIKIKYSGDIKKVRLLNNGNVLIRSAVNDIQEYAPNCFNVAGLGVPIAFSLKNGVIGFNFPSGYSNQETLTIDPWVTAVTNFSSAIPPASTGCGYDVDHDAAGNTYVYGSTSGFKVAQYDASGNLQWTFSGTLASPSWNSGSSWAAGIAVNKLLGKVYISRSFSNYGELRLNSSGNYDSWITPSTTVLYEVGDLGFTCSGDLMVFGGAFASGKLVSVPGMSIVQQSFFTSYTSCCQDVVCHAIDDYGNIFVLLGSGTGTSFNSLANNLISVNTSLNGNNWVQPTGYSSFTETNGRLGLAVSPVGGTYFKCLAVNSNYLYYYDGYNLGAYSKSTGTLVASTTVFGQTVKQQGGIAVDECDNLYLGGSSSILCYHFSGTAFSTLTPISIGSTLTSQYVYDLQLDKITSVLYATGSGFVGTYAALSSTACSTSSCNCVQPFLSTNTSSVVCPNIGASTVSVLGMPGPFTYTWLPGGQNTPTVTGLSPGTYTVAVTSLSCGGTYTTTASFSASAAPYSVAVYPTSITCASLGSATVIPSGLLPPYSYTWMPTAQTGSAAANLGPGNYSITVFSAGCNLTFTSSVYLAPLVPLTGNIYNTNSVSCFGASTGTGVVTNLAGGSGSQNYLWTNGSTSLTTSSVSALSAGIWSISVTDALTGCQIGQSFIVSQPPQQSISMSSSSPTACVNTTIGLTGTSSGGTPGYTYFWSGGPLTNSYVVSNSLAGTYTYTLFSTDANTCTISNTVSVNFIQTPVITVANVSICPNEIGILNAGGATTYTWNTGVIGSALSDSPVSNHQYTVVGTAFSCTSAATASIILKPVPIPMLMDNSPICSGKDLMLSGFGGVSFLWLGPSNFTSSLQYPDINPVGLNNFGVYTLVVTAPNSCTASITKTITVDQTPTITAIGSTVCTSQTLQLSATSLSGLTYTWSGPQSFSSSFQNPSIANPALNSTGTYTVNVTAINGCTNTATCSASVILLPSVTGSFNPTGTLCAQALNNSAHSIELNFSGANTYTILAPNYISSTNPSGSSSTISVLSPYTSGVNTLAIVGSNGVCTAFTILNFSVIPNPNITVGMPTATICPGESYTYLSQGAVTYSWNTGAHGPSIVVSPTVTSLYSVIGTSLGCNSATQTNTLTVNPLPKLSVIPNTPTICLNEKIQLTAYGDANTFTWSPAYGLNAINGITVVAGPLVQQTYTVTGALNSCTTSAVITVSVLPLPQPAAVLLNPKVCLNELVTLQGGGGINYEWKGPQNFGSAAQTATFIAYNPAMAGTYTLYVSDINSCTNLTSIDLTIYDLPDGYLQGTKMQACVPFSSDFEFHPAPGSASISTQWLVDKKSFTGPVFSYPFQIPGDYTIQGYFKDPVTNCINTKTFVINAYPLPIADFTVSPERPVENTDEVMFTNTSTGDSKKWNWFFMNNAGRQSQNKNTSYLFEDAGIYPVAMIVTNSWGCADTIVKLIQIFEDFDVYVPNVFTPNNDELNDIFLPIIRGVKQYDLAIYNRWGARIFHSIDPQKGWDGSFSGQPCKDDVYIWKLTLSSNSGESKTQTGHVTLYR